MGTTYASMGLVTMLFPNTVLHYSLYGQTLQESIITASPASAVGIKVFLPSLVLMTRCFGAQAFVCGSLVLNAEFTMDTFKTFGLLMLPFIAFDWIAYDAGMISLLGAIGDLAGNLVFISCCFYGYKALTAGSKKK